MNIADLSTKQRAALDRFAAKHGRGWKDDLRAAWWTGNYGAIANTDDAAYLQQVRNTFGPVLLARYKRGAP